MTVDIPRCRKFTGYKPCHPGEHGETCVSPEPIGTKILIINRGALGAVLMTTTILPAIKRKYPESTVHWLTQERAAPLLHENPYIDTVYPLSAASLLILQAMKFDVVCNTDKDRAMGALTHMLDADVKLGYGINDDGVIVPLNSGAEYNYRLGIDNELKFRRNVRTYVAMLREMLELDTAPDPYVFTFNSSEEDFIKSYRETLGLKKNMPVAGINTGSSLLFPHKKLPEKAVETLIPALYEMGGKQKIILLGGLEDGERNAELAEKFPGMVVNTPTHEGLRRGMCYVALCDVVLTGDSLGMHMAVALGKMVVAWFNVSCAPEIELYGRGEKVISRVHCSPCWKRECDNSLICLEEDIGGEMLRAYDILTKSNV